MVKVSVIVPVYRVEKTLERCVESIVNQTIEDIEIILVDDGSPDSCPILCDKLSEMDKRIKVIHKNNEGLGYARNSGLEIAQGEYIGFVDSDDYISRNMYELLYTEAKENDADASFCGICYVNKKQIKYSQFEKEKKVFRGKSGIKEILMNRLAANPSEKDDSKYGATITNGIYKRNIIERYNIRFKSEKEYISEDTIFGMMLLSKSEVALMIPNHCYFYEYNPKSLTSSYRRDRYEKNKELYYYVINFITLQFNDYDMVMKYKRAFIAAARVSIIQEILNGNGISGIKRILSDNDFIKIHNSYEWKKLPFSKRIFSFFMSHKLYILLYISVKIKWRKDK